MSFMSVVSDELKRGPVNCISRTGQIIMVIGLLALIITTFYYQIPFFVSGIILQLGIIVFLFGFVVPLFMRGEQNV